MLGRPPTVDGRGGLRCGPSPPIRVGGRPDTPTAGEPGLSLSGFRGEEGQIGDDGLIDPDLRSFLWLSFVMLGAGTALALALRTPWGVIAAFVLLAALGLMALTRSEGDPE